MMQEYVTKQQLNDAINYFLQIIKEQQQESWNQEQQIQKQLLNQDQKIQDLSNNYNNLKNDIKKIKALQEQIFKLKQEQKEIQNKVEKLNDMEKIQADIDSIKNQMKRQNESESESEMENSIIVFKNYNALKQQQQQIENKSQNKQIQKPFQENLNEQSQDNSSGQFGMYQQSLNPSNQCGSPPQNSEILSQGKTKELLEESNYYKEYNIYQHIQLIFKELNLIQRNLFGESQWLFGEEQIFDYNDIYAQHLIHFREVQEQGNCFYTAFGFQLIYLISGYDENKYKKFTQKIKDIIFQIYIKNEELDFLEFNTLIQYEFLNRLELIRSIQNKDDRIQWLIKLYTAEIDQDSQLFDGCFYGLSQIFFRNLVYHVVKINKIYGLDKSAEYSILKWEAEFALNNDVIQQLAQFLDIRIIMIQDVNGIVKTSFYNNNCEDKIILYIKESIKTKINIVTQLQSY